MMAQALGPKDTPRFASQQYQKTFDELESYRHRLRKAFERLHEIEAALYTKRDELFQRTIKGAGILATAEGDAKTLEDVKKLSGKVFDAKKACESFHQQLLENLVCMVAKTGKQGPSEDLAAELYHQGFKIGYESRRFVEVEDFIKTVAVDQLRPFQGAGLAK